MMKFPARFVSLALLLGAGLALAEEKKVDFQGKVTEVDLAAKTITIRAGTKDFVFQINPQRCKIVKDGFYPSIPGAQSPALESARAGDSAIGTLVVDAGQPVVTELYLTTKPEPGVRVTEKVGHITTPYSLLSHTPGEQGAIDVRGYARGSMLVDKKNGKIFLVP